MSDKEKIMDKIRKCLALASSDNEHEAAAALRQAQKLMELHRVSDTDILAANVSASVSAAGAIKKPASWETTLAVLVSKAFGCKLIFQSDWNSGKWKFIGISANAEVAQYAFCVLLRQVKKSRAAFIKGECKRLVPASKTRRADLFCQAWVSTAASKVHALVPQERNAEAISAYMQQHHPSLKEMEARDRNATRKLRDKDWDTIDAGSAAGRRAQLNHGVGGNVKPTLLG